MPRWQRQALGDIGADDLHLGLHRQAQGRDDQLPQHPRRGARHHRAAGLDADTTHLSYLPLCHVAEQMLTAFVPLYLGSRVNFGESIRTVQDDLREVAPTMFLGVPRIWEKLHAAISIKMQEAGALHAPAVPARHRGLRAVRREGAGSGAGRAFTYALAYWLVFRALQNFIGLRRARIALTGAAPIPPLIVRFFRTLGVPLVEVYGMTESSGMVLGQRNDVLVGTVGRPRWAPSAPGRQRASCWCAATWCSRATTRTRRPRPPPSSTAGCTPATWCREEGGQLRIVDRLKDIMITAGGKNLTPSEIENTMKSSPFIKECIVVARAASSSARWCRSTPRRWASGPRTQRLMAFTAFPIAGRGAA
jgi:long-chain acyl-CoA synthetase